MPQNLKGANCRQALKRRRDIKNASNSVSVNTIITDARDTEKWSTVQNNCLQNKFWIDGTGLQSTRLKFILSPELQLDAKRYP
jgi:hypothetical protein